MKRVLVVVLILALIGGAAGGAIAWTNDGASQDEGLTEVSQGESADIAEQYLISSPTFQYDGLEGSMTLVETITARCPFCWQFIFEFQTAHAGHGDRTGAVLAQVITTHTAKIMVQEGEITSAVCCDEWNMMTQSPLGSDDAAPELEGILSVSELLENPVYDTNVLIYGKVGLLGELFCPCFLLTSGGQELEVWYGLMVEDDGTERPAVSVEGIENGDWVVVTGELKSDGIYRSLNDFWVGNVEKCVDDSYAGEEVTVAVGDILAVVLESNPTTGFRWTLAENSDGAVLQQSGQKFEADLNDPPLMGAGGVEVWTFKPLARGESAISMEYRRPWEQGAEPAETFTFTVVVE